MFGPTTPLDATWPATARRRDPTWVRLLGAFDSPAFRLLAFAALVPLLVRTFGPAQYSWLAVCAAMFAWLELAPRAVAAEAARLAAAALHVGHFPRAGRLASAAVALLGAVALPGAILLTTFSAEVCVALGVGGADIALCALYLTLAALRYVVLAVASVHAATATARGFSPELRALRGLDVLFDLAAAVFVVAQGLSLPWLAAFRIVGALLVGWLWRELAAGRGHTVRVGLHTIDGAALGELARAPLEAPPVVAAGLAGLDVATLALAATLGVGALVPWVVTVAAARLGLGLALQVGAAVVADARIPGGSGGRGTLREKARRLHDATLTAAVGPAVWVAILSGPAVALAIGAVPALSPATVPVGLAVLAAVPAALAIRSPAAQGGVLAVAVLVAEALLAGAGTWWLTPPLGAFGAGLAVLGAHAATAAWYWPLRQCRALGMRVRTFVWGRAWRVVLVALPCALAAVVLTGFKPARSARTLLVQTAILLILQAVAGFAGWYLLRRREGEDQDA